ncbi:MAG: MBL fold metallo-hydrolase, partial [Treponema sp.]|uniref:MBL fold metallo-hydrolase n=1 Tax=Treponema sp. TaxID=166 RepID=UPI00298E50B8
CLCDLIENGTSIRNYPPVMAAEDLNADYILCTHDHIDHLAVETVSKAAASSKTKFIVPEGCVEILAELGIPSDRITGIADQETKVFEKFSVKGISTAHPVHQKDSNGKDRNLAFAISIDDRQIVHLGDTYYTARLEKALKELNAIDIFIVPINGMDDEKAKAGIIGNLSIEEAADLCSKLDVANAVPSHFDMVKGNTADPIEFEKLMKEKCPEQKVWIPELDKVFQF